MDYDFSLIKLSRKIVFDAVTKAPIALADSDEFVGDQTPVLVSGWGDTKSVFESNQYLRAVILNVVNFESCEVIYAYHGGVTDRMICAAGKDKDSCQG